MNRIKFSLILFILFFLLLSLVSCSRKKGGDTSLPSGDNAKPVPAVCIWDGINVRESPSISAKAFSTLSLGESLIYLGITQADSASENLEYAKLELSDGALGWVAQSGIVENAYPAVIINAVPVYKRPDLLTISNETLNTMDVIAVVEEKDDWVQFVSERKRRTGWVKVSVISKTKEDIALAVLAGKRLKNSEGQPAYEAIENLLENNPYPNSIFVETLKSIAREEREKESLEHVVKSYWE
ncbi:MAG: SH3 domain-containing protein [Bacteroidales bacterium]|nr:SH3 domain-containing protein [Bacteroidales bacterium]